MVVVFVILSSVRAVVNVIDNVRVILIAAVVSDKQLISRKQ